MPTSPAPDNHTFDGQLRVALRHYRPPSFPTVIARALTTLNDSRSELAEVGRILATDPRTTIKLLSLTNSPMFSFRTPVLSVEHAVSMLGRSRLEALLLTMGVRQALPRPPSLDVDRFWHAAGRRATLARALCERTDPQQAALCFTAALLQDLAVPFLLERLSDVYTPLLAEWRNTGEALDQLESASFGFNHADVGGFLCEDWGFPELLTAAVGAHHKAQRRYSSIPPPPVQLVACLKEGDPPYGESEFVEASAQRTGLSTDELCSLLAQAEGQAQTVASLYR